MQRSTQAIEAASSRLGSSRANGSRFRAERQRREWRGRVAELVAAGLLLLKGYRILARRQRGQRGGPVGEIDLIAVRGRRLAFVEVKLRRSLDEARASISSRQAARTRNAAVRWVWRHPRYRDHVMGFDAVLVSPGFVPHHAPDALQAP